MQDGSSLGRTSRIMTDVEKLNSLIDRFGGGSKKRFADAIGVPRSNVATWLLRGSITANGREAILDAFPQVSREWLLDGKQMPDGSLRNFASRAMEQQVITFSPSDLVPYFDTCRASCGVAEMLENPEDVTDFIRLPGARATAAIPATGDSMEPTIHEGDTCLVGKQLRLEDVNPRRIYLVVTSDNLCAFKRISDPGPNADHVLLVSENPDYVPQVKSIQKSTILKIYPLKYVVRNID